MAELLRLEGESKALYERRKLKIEMHEPSPDFTVAEHGSIFTVTPQNDTATAWVNENISLESWQWMGNSFAVDQHYIDDLVIGIQDAGFIVGG